VEELASNTSKVFLIEYCFTSIPCFAKITEVMELLSPEDASAVGNMQWLQSITGWSSYKISRLCRLKQIKGSFQSQPRTRGSMWCFRKSKTLAWLESLETK
jgi:hypothetical protein